MRRATWKYSKKITALTDLYRFSVWPDKIATHLVHLAAPQISFASILFGWNRRREAFLFQPLTTLGPFFPVATTGISHSAILGHQDQPTPFFELNSSLPINHELPDSPELFYQGGSHHQPSGQPTSGLLHPISFWASIDILTARMWLWRIWATFSMNWTREAQGHQVSLEKAKPARQPHPLPDCAKAISRRVG